MRRDRACYLVATIIGVVVLLLAVVGGQDANVCLLTGLMPFGGLCLGYAEPRKAWRWPTTMLATLMITGAAIEISSGDAGAGPPLGLVHPTVLVVPLVLSFILANIGSTLCRTERMKLDEALAREISEASSNAGRSDSHPAE
ncbi:MAG: hypothetical protein IT450_10250 [Phycisphaerales bacterium]|nr:hypothetical protein [Phycisphaerales bacterium]